MSAVSIEPQEPVDTNTMMQRRNRRVTEQLLAELEAKRYDSALTRRIIAAPGAFPRLLRACFLAQDRRFAAARADVDEALAHGRQNPVVALAAGMILYATRDYGRAIELLEHAAALEPKAGARARQQIIAIASELGWDHDVRRAIEAGIAAEPARVSWHAHAVRLFVLGRDYERAIEHARRCVELDPSLASMWMELASLAGRVDRRDEARAALDEALARAQSPGQASGEAEFHRAAAHVAIDVGEFERARAQLERAAALEPDAPGDHVALAELASWRGDFDGARAQTELALVLDADCGPALRMRGALELHAGQQSAALASLEAAIAAAPDDYQAPLWLAELHRQRGALDEAHAALSRAVATADDYLLPISLNRFLLVAREAESPATEVPPARLDDLVDGLRELCPELAQRALASRRTDDTVAAVEAALAALGANRSVQSTAAIGPAGALVRLHTRSGCRHAARHALMLLRVAEAPRCLAAFEPVIERYPESSLPLCHRGELHLWLGDFDRAKADLERAIEIVSGTRWAYIGLSTFGLLDDDYEGSLAVNARGVRIMNDTEGPAIHVYRGEAYRKLGKLAKATRELDAAVEHHPARASAVINLALTHYAAGRDAAGDRLWLRLRDEQACGLLSDAARELDIELWPDEDDEREPLARAHKIAVLDRALEMMGGNRSSGLLSYWTAAGRLRFVPIWPPRGEAPHARDRVYLDNTKRLLLRALTRYSGPRAAS